MAKLIYLPLPPKAKKDQDDSILSMVIDVEKVIAIFEYQELLMVKLPDGITVFTHKDAYELILQAARSEPSSPIPDAFMHAFDSAAEEDEEEEPPKNVFEGDNFWDKYGNTEG